MQLINALILLMSELPAEMDPEAEEVNLFLFMFVVIAVVTTVALAAIGLIIALVVAVTGGALLVSGAAITSSVVAASRKSPSLGLILFVIQIASAAGAVLGAATGLAYSYLHHLPLLNLRYTGTATLAGLLAFALLSWATVKFWISVWNQLLPRLRRLSGPKS